MLRGPGRILLIPAVLMGGILLAYDIKDLQVKPAVQYAAHQNFQGLVIGAYACNTLARTQELFDTDKLIEKQIMPVLLVVENKNEFPVQLVQSEIFLIDPSGEGVPPIPYIDVLLRVNTKGPASATASMKDLKKVVKKEMLLDFEHKSFGEKLIAPSASDHGVVFYPLPPSGNLEGYRLYLPEVLNFSSNEVMMFFEFDLE